MTSLFLQFLRNLFLRFLLFVRFVYKTCFSNSGSRKNRSPSPPKLPIIGNLHQLSPSLHRSYQSLSKQYGKLLVLHLGYKPTLLVSSADAVRDIMKTHDVAFSNRPELCVARRIFYDRKNVAFAPYGDYWKQMRRVSVFHLLSNKNVQSFRNIREDETALIIEKISRSCSTVVNLSEIVMTFTNNVICRAAFGKKYNTSDGSIIFKELLHEVAELLRVFCLEDFIPCLRWVDQLKGLNGRIKRVVKDLDEFFEEVLREHHYGQSMKKDFDVECDKGKKVEAFVDILLDYQRENKDALAADNIKAVILDMFVAGTGTIHALVEWTMCELIRHPKIMIELQETVRKVGAPSNMICEENLDKLTYLKAVIKEALRLHPPAPLLNFRESLQDAKVNGYDIAVGPQVVINAWAIQRDPCYWENPEEFRPERFLNNTATFKGQDFHFIPFGGGRRICPGMSFSTVSAELVVANLINKYNWKLPGGAQGVKLDMAESIGITVCKRDPLMLIATPYSRG